LFADGPPRAGTTWTGQIGPDARPDWSDTGGLPRSTGAGNGRVPAVWGPDGDEPPADDDTGWHTGSWESDGKRPGSTWLRLAALVAAIIVITVGVVFAFNLGRGSGGAGTAGPTTGTSSSASTPAHTPLRIAGVTDFDPLGNPPQENPQLAPLAADGKPGTAWQTSTYFDPFPKFKTGVGLLVDLGKPRTVGRVKVTLMGSPTSLQILAAPGASAAPSGTDGLDTVATAKNAGTRVDLTLRKPVTTQWLVVWLTSLPTAPGGYQGRVAEISVSS
jgi:hypothetical protein